MPITLPASHPAREKLARENIFLFDEDRAIHQDIRPLSVLILNLMPTKVVTETQLLRKLSNSPLQVEATLLQTSTYRSSHTDATHLDRFYETFDQIKDRRFDGLIITGAPLDYVDYEEVAYWDEVCKIMEWSKTHVHCTFHLCWGAYAGLYYHFGIRKFDRPKKLFGVLPHKIYDSTCPLFRGFDNPFMAPQSRATDVHLEDVIACPDLELLATTMDGSFAIAKTHDNRQFYVTCHTEYDRDTLKLEYDRDMAKGLTSVDKPVNYYPDDDPSQTPVQSWSTYGQLLYGNWLNFYVYQSTPYVKDEIK